MRLGDANPVDAARVAQQFDRHGLGDATVAHGASTGIGCQEIRLIVDVAPQQLSDLPDLRLRAGHHGTSRSKFQATRMISASFASPMITRGPSAPASRRRLSQSKFPIKPTICRSGTAIRAAPVACA